MHPVIVQATGCGVLPTTQNMQHFGGDKPEQANNASW